MVKAVQLNLRDTWGKSSLSCPNDCQVKSEESSLENSLVENIADGKSWSEKKPKHKNKALHLAKGNTSSVVAVFSC